MNEVDKMKLNNLIDMVSIESSRFTILRTAGDIRMGEAGAELVEAKRKLVAYVARLVAEERIYTTDAG